MIILYVRPHNSQCELTFERFLPCVRMSHVAWRVKLSSTFVYGATKRWNTETATASLYAGRSQARRCRVIVASEAGSNGVGLTWNPPSRMFFAGADHQFGINGPLLLRYQYHRGTRQKKRKKIEMDVTSFTCLGLSREKYFLHTC